MDPSTFISAISGILQAMQVWYASKDAEATQAAYKNGAEQARLEPSFRSDVAFLTRIVPQRILDIHASRVERCYADYEDTLTGDFSQQEIDRAIVHMRACVCRELRRIIQIGERIPPGKLREAWQEFCDPKFLHPGLMV